MAKLPPWSSLRKNLNFFRIHLLFFTFTPLIASGIFYAANGENHIDYIDALFNCLSACLVCGLATVDLSALTGFQQALLFFLMSIGNPVVVSWVIVYTRRHYFTVKCEHIIEAQIKKREEEAKLAKTNSRPSAISRTFTRVFTYQTSARNRALSVVPESRNSTIPESQESTDLSEKGNKKRWGPFSRKTLKKLRPEMIRRMDITPKLVDPSGYITEEPQTLAAPANRAAPSRTPLRTPTPAQSSRSGSVTPANDIEKEVAKENLNLTGSTLRGDMSSSEQSQLDDIFSPALAAGSPVDSRQNGTADIIAEGASRMPRTTTFPRSVTMNRIATVQGGPSRGVPLGHTMTVEFRTPEIERGHTDRSELRGRRGSSVAPFDNNRSRSELGSNLNLNHHMDGVSATRVGMGRRYSVVSRDGEAVVHDDRYDGPGRTGVPLAYRSATSHTHHTTAGKSAMHTGYGGFPMPQTLFLKLVRKLFPGVEKRFVRTLTVQRTRTLQAFPTSGTHPTQVSNREVKSVPYITFEAIVGRNSKFHKLTEENLEELGGVEYRALTALLWIVGAYHLGVQLIAFTIIAPYISLPRWRGDLEPPNLHRYVPPTWFAAFQVVTAYTNAGMSLVDQSMVPFQRAYPIVLAMALLILAGNTAFPVFLRLTIWLFSKIVPKTSRTNETLHFLLDHPRRCFIYLFPSHQTWFLFTVLLFLNGTDYFFFLVLDIGNPTIDAIPVGVRFVIGLLQATAVRAAGFATVTLSALAPAVQALYVMMMYISVYPIAMSVRSTNVYEEKSLGVYDESDDEDEDEPNENSLGGGGGGRVAVWGRYLAWHARRQLAFDMWWLGLALFFVCIIERSKIQDENNFQWFTIFTIIFELISAYGGVGLSLGVPYANFSFSGAFTPLSKLIVCLVMLRGRHRGLPVAIDRAVLLPAEYKKKEGNGVDDTENIIAQAGFKPSITQTQAQAMNEKGHINGNSPIIDDTPQNERGLMEEDVPPQEKSPLDEKAHLNENGLA